MKKTSLLCTLLLSAPLFAGVALQAQESRQDVSISGFVPLTPDVHGSGGQTQRATKAVGGLVSYRFLLTPRSALEANYGYTQNTNYFKTSGTGLTFIPVHTRQQELSLAYVYGLTFKRYTPFLEGGIAAMLFSPLRDAGTARLDGKRTTNLGALFGAGVAYEISPSFDVRAEYRGVYTKAPSFGIGDFNSTRYNVIMMPSIGVAYHF